jgi:hypothetical protein
MPGVTALRRGGSSLSRYSAHPIGLIRPRTETGSSRVAQRCRLTDVAGSLFVPPEKLPAYDVLPNAFHRTDEP